MNVNFSFYHIIKKQGGFKSLKMMKCIVVVITSLASKKCTVTVTSHEILNHRRTLFFVYEIKEKYILSNIFWDLSDGLNSISLSNTLLSLVHNVAKHVLPHLLMVLLCMCSQDSTATCSLVDSASPTCDAADRAEYYYNKLLSTQQIVSLTSYPTSLTKYSMVICSNSNSNSTSL